jgi:hypothetical protein
MLVRSTSVRQQDARETQCLLSLAIFAVRRMYFGLEPRDNIKFCVKLSNTATGLLYFLRDGYGDKDLSQDDKRADRTAS